MNWMDNYARCRAWSLRKNKNKNINFQSSNGNTLNGDYDIHIRHDYRDYRHYHVTKTWMDKQEQEQG